MGGLRGDAGVWGSVGRWGSEDLLGGLELSFRRKVVQGVHDAVDHVGVVLVQCVFEAVGVRGEDGVLVVLEQMVVRE